MNIIYSPHANESLEERHISRSLINETLSSPDAVSESKKGRKIAQKGFGNKNLRVIYKDTGKSYIVVTCYFRYKK